jgi:hypothetical protein
MNEDGRFSPIDIIKRRRAEIDAEMTRLPTEVGGIQRRIDEIVIAKIVKLIENSQQQPIPRVETKTTEVEGQSGRASRREKLRAVRLALQNQATRMLKTDVVETRHETSEKIQSIDEVHFHLIMDASQTSLIDGTMAKSFLKFLLGMYQITPEFLNEKQSNAQIKKVKISLTLSVPTPDGHKLVKLWTIPTAQEAMTKYVEFLQAAGTYADTKYHTPRLSQSAKVLDIFEHTDAAFSETYQENVVNLGIIAVQDQDLINKQIEFPTSQVPWEEVRF